MDPQAAWLSLGGASYVMRSSAARALVNIGLVVGSRKALVVDTGCGPRHGADILAAVRTVTSLPLVVTTTHAHWDHFFGNAVFRDHGVTDFWAHAAAARDISATGDSQRAAVAGVEPEMAAGAGACTDLVLPNRLVHDHPVTLDLGGVKVELFTLGPAHTDGDLLVGAPGVLFAGDILEEGAEPQCDDASPDGWIRVLRTLAAMGGKYPVMVPGHGRPVTAEFALRMAQTMERAG